MSDDFFNNELSSPPKQASAISQSMRRNGPPPPPPPRMAGGTTGTSLGASNSNSNSNIISGPPPLPSRPAPTPSAARPSPGPSLRSATATHTTASSRTAAAPAGGGSATTRPRPTPHRPAAATATASSVGRGTNISTSAGTLGTGDATAKAARPLPTASTARARAMSRPVGQYYAAATAATPSTTTITGISPTFTPALVDTAEDTWDWGSPAGSAPVGSIPPLPVGNANAIGGPATTPAAHVNQWAAPPKNNTTTGAAVDTDVGDDDWYERATSDAGDTISTAGASSTMQPNAYSGFYGGTANIKTPEWDPYLSGSMDDAHPYNPTASAAAAAAPSSFRPPNLFIPKPSSMASFGSSGGSVGGGADSTSTTIHPNYNNSNNNTLLMNTDEAPLMEELGINLQHIAMKTKAVLFPFRSSKRLQGQFSVGDIGDSGDDEISNSNTMENPQQIVQDADLAGPIAFCLILGAEMVLTGKLQFGYIYGFGVFGCLSMTLIVNLMSPLADGISVWTVSSVLGYALLPVNVLGVVKLFVMNRYLVNLPLLGHFLAVLTVAWSTVASTRLLELGCGLREQRYLIAYPVALLYSAFVMITIF